MKANKTRKVMLTATFLSLAACSGVEESNMPPGDDDMGSGSDTQVAGKLTIDGSDFVDDGTTLWSATKAPQLHGTFEASGPVTITVVAGAGAPVTATLEGSTWSAKLSDDSITTSSVNVTVTMTTTDGAKVELSKLFGFDGAPPAITLLPSIVRDERGDQIDFSSGEPVHTHVGAEIDLANGACPSVYKYAYLMSARSFGSATTPNDLAWHIRIADAKLALGSERYRVRSEDGTPIVNWSTLPAADGTGVSTLKLDRTAVPQLGTTSGKFYIDVRASDTTDNQTTSTFCIDNHPLAAPLKVEPLANVSTGLLSWSFAADSPISNIMNAQGGALLSQQRFYQHTGEPIVLRPSASVGVVGFARTYVTGYVSFGSQRVNQDLAGAAVTPATGEIVGGETQQYSVNAVVYDDTTNQILIGDLSGNITIPGRAANEPPHAYRIEMGISQMAQMRPTPTANVGEYTAAGKTYTGLAPQDTQYVCQEGTTICMGHLNCTCMADVYVNTTALTYANIAIDTPTVTLKTAAAASAASETTITSSAPTIKWDAGTGL